MDEKEKQVVETGEKGPMTEDYLATIEKLKKNTVSKEEYDKLLEENRKLLNNYVNGQSEEPGTPKEEKEDIKALRNKLFGKNSEELSNLDFADTALKLRNALIADGQPDPFLPIGKQIAPDESDIAAAQRVADVLEDCVKYADGDSGIFTNELQRRTIDIKVR